MLNYQSGTNAPSRAFSLILGAGIAALSFLPGVLAEKPKEGTVAVKSTGEMCKETSTGEACHRSSLPAPAKAAIAVSVVAVVLLLSFVGYYIHRTRQRSVSSEQTAAVTDLEAAQMAGPPTVLAATYNPDSGKPVYTIGSAGSEGHWTPVNVHTPAPGAQGSSMQAAQQERGLQMQMPTGPVAPYTPGGTRVSKFPYPFGGMGSAVPSARGT